MALRGGDRRVTGGPRVPRVRRGGGAVRSGGSWGGLARDVGTGGGSPGTARAVPVSERLLPFTRPRRSRPRRCRAVPGYHAQMLK